MYLARRRCNRRSRCRRSTHAVEGEIDGTSLEVVPGARAILVGRRDGTKALLDADTLRTTWSGVARLGHIGSRSFLYSIDEGSAHEVTSGGSVAPAALSRDEIAELRASTLHIPFVPSETERRLEAALCWKEGWLLPTLACE